MWWESRRYGLRAIERSHGDTVAWVVPNGESEIEWSARFVKYPAKVFYDPHLAWDYAIEKLGDDLHWWIFRIANNKPLRRIRRGSTR